MVIRDIFSNDHTWALELKETGHVIGCMGYYPYGESNIEIGEHDVEVGYWIGKPYWNKGLCTEALRAMIDYCFNTKGFKNIWADFFIDNPASGRVMEKCGMSYSRFSEKELEYQGEMRDLTYYEVTREAWERVEEELCARASL